MNEDLIKENNIAINNLTKEILELKSKCGISSIEVDENGEPKLREVFQEMLDTRLRLCLNIYSYEFINLVDDKKQEMLDESKVFLKNKKGIDGYKHAKGVEFTSGTQESLEYFKKKLYGFTEDENGKITFEDKLNNIDELEKSGMKLIGKKGERHLIDENELIEAHDLDKKSMFKYIKYLSLTNSQDIDFFISVIPHEAMHRFGFSGGISEGITETFTREISKKYNLSATPLAHPFETSIIQKIEKIIGVDNLSRLTIDFKDNKESENYLEFAKFVELNIPSKENSEYMLQLLKNENNFFYTNENDPKKEEYREIYLKSLDNIQSFLEEYVLENPDKLKHELGENNIVLNEEQKVKKEIKFNEIIKMQEREIENLESVKDKFIELSESIIGEEYNSINPSKKTPDILDER